MKTTKSPFLHIMKFSGLLPFIMFFVFVGNSLYGQQYRGDPFVVDYDVPEYRINNQNWSIDINDKGIVYIGKKSGLLEFDGSNWNLYSMPDKMVIRSVSASGDSIVYVGAYEEFGYWKRDNKGRMEYNSLSDTVGKSYFHNDEIWRIVQHNNKVFFQSFSNIYVYDGKNIEVINPTNTIVLLLKARDRLFVHMVGKGLFELKDENLDFIKGSGHLANDEIKIVLPYGADDFLIGAARNGMFVYDGEQFTPWNNPVNRDIRDAEVNVGLATEDLLFIGTVVDGIFILDKQGNLRDHLHAGNHLNNNTVLSMATDKRNNIWAGLDQGLHYIKMNNMLDVYANSSKNIGSVFDAELTENNLWVGTNQGLFRYQHDDIQGFTNHKMIDGSQGQVWDIEKVNGALLCGHNTGTYKISGNRWQQISSINGGFELKKIRKNNEEYLLQSTYSSLVIYKKTSDGWQFSNVISGVLEPIPDIEIDPQGYIWAAHAQKGVFRITLNNRLDSIFSTRYFGINQGFNKENRIRLTKINNRIVFSTRELLYTYDDLKDSIVPYEKLNQQLGNFKAARKIIQVRDNHYWFILENQIALFKITNKEVYRTFYYDLSRLNLYLTTNFPNIEPLRDSLHLICLDQGFAILDESRIRQGKDSPEVLMKKVIANSQREKVRFLPLQTKKRVEIDYAYRNLEFTFYGKQSFLSNEFRYKLEGLNEQWSEWQNSSTVNFTRLPWGKYTFMVQTKDIQGKESEPLVYRFLISPPWYASDTAWAIYITLIIAGIVILKKVFKKRLKIHKQKIEEEEKEKRRQERIREEQKYTKLKNEKLQNEISHKSIQLANYTMTIIRKNELLVNIRKELEKQKEELGSRFPDYYYKKLLKMLDRGISSEEEWEQFEYHFDQAHANFFKRLKQQHPELTQADLKLCAYLRLNLSSKEIAPLLNISVRSVEVRRYRLRKRLNLNREQNLVEFLLNF